MNSGQYPPPPYQPGPYPPSAYNNPQPHSYRDITLAVLVIGYILSFIMVVVEIMVTSGMHATTDTTSSTSSGSGILGGTGAVLLIAVNIIIMVLDGRSFFSLFGNIQWRRLKGWLRILLGFAYLCIWIMPPIYLVMAVRRFASARQQSTVGVMAAWYRQKSPGARMSIIVASLLLILSFATFTSFAVIAHSSCALALLPP